MANQKENTPTTEEMLAMLQAQIAQLKEELEAAKAEKHVPAPTGKGVLVAPAPEPKFVKLRLFKDGFKYKEAMFVGVNGRTWLIPRGVEVEVPDYVAEVVNRSQEEDQRMEDFLREKEEEFNTSPLAK